MGNLDFKANHPNPEQVLTKAILNLAAIYDLTGKDLSEIMGISEASATRLHQGKKFISAKSKEGELALLLIRLYRSLNALVGSDSAKAKSWLNSYNYYFNKRPIEHIKRIDGLVKVINYLDAMRGKT